MSLDPFWALLVERSKKRDQGNRLERVLKMLDSPAINERYAAIFALEGLAHEDDGVRGILVDLLSAFVRRVAGTAVGVNPDIVMLERVPGDVQAALTVLGRRVWQSSEERPLDLHGIALREAYLPMSDFSGAFLYDCDLEGALLCNAKLKGAWLWRTNLRRANLDGADIRGADLSGARYLTPEQLSQTLYDDDTRLPPQIRPNENPWKRLSQSFEYNR